MDSQIMVSNKLFYMAMIAPAPAHKYNIAAASSEHQLLQMIAIKRLCKEERKLENMKMILLNIPAQAI